MSALYQRARPVTFDQVVGQEHVKDVLGSAVARGLTGHAYLFSGPRGVGKTTTARLMAMAVNCEREDPAERPCGTCESCRLVREGSHPDVMELDAASNNSVDDVRALREQVGLASLRGGTRVWILDEAHMLSRPAANALLKTLEEPPPGLMFLLATTEPEKLPPTILSRCQHFRFRRLTDAEILGKLERLCEEAGVEAAPEALSLVARAADGAMRDAESLLERLLVAGGKVTAEDAEDALGLPPRERLVGLAQALLDGDLAVTLTAAGDLYRSGFAPRTVAEQLGRTLRDLLHDALKSDAAEDRGRLVRLIHALDDEHERFVRRDDLYALEVALIKASNAATAPLDTQATVAELSAAGHAAEGLASRAAPTTAPARTAAPAQRPAAPQAEPGHKVTAEQPARQSSPGTAAQDTAPAAGAPSSQRTIPTQEPAATGSGEQGKPFSWHAVRSAAAPQIKAFLQPAQVHVDDRVVTLEYDENWRFHFDQVVARREELETLVEKVAGPGYVVELKGPRGSAGGGRGSRGARSARESSPANKPRRDDAASASSAAPSRATTVSPDSEPRPAEERPTRAEGQEAAASAGNPRPDAESRPPQDPTTLYGDLPEGFWEQDDGPGTPDGAVPGAYEAGGPEPGGSGTADAVSDEASLSRLQALFPGRVVEFVPNAKTTEEDAAPLPDEDEVESYDDDGQERLGFGVPPVREG